jgi:2-methylcitrate dehydratase PrpD
MAQAMKTETAASRLATFVHDLRFEMLPDDVIHTARRSLIDTLGAALGGVETDAARACLAGVKDFDAGDQVTLWGTAQRASAPAAALVNGTLSHAIEMDDFSGCDHSGAVVIPSALAVAEAVGGHSGRDLLVAIVAGYDIARRPMEAAGGYTPHNGRGWHSTGTCGSFGAAATAGRMMNLDTAQLTSAIGLAGSFTGGVWAFIDDGAMSKRLHPGRAAENGVTSAFLARRGLTGPTRIFEADWGGFLSTYAPDSADLEALTSGLGESYRIMKSGIKPYASCRGVHSAIDGLLKLRVDYGVESDNVARITVYGSPFDVGMVGGTNVATMLAAQMSLPYGLAVTLLTGEASIAQYTDERRSSPEVLATLAKITMVPDSEMTDDDEPIVEVALIDGRVMRMQIPIALGAATNPLSDDQLARKFRSLAGMAFSEALVEELLDMLWHIDSFPNVAPLWARLRTGN